MHNEAGDGIRIAANVVIIAYVLFVIVSLVFLGINYLRESTSKLDNAVIEAEAQEFYDLVNIQDKIQVSNVYVVLRRNADKIDVIKGTVGGLAISSIYDLENVLKYDVNVSVKVNTQGLLEVTLTE